MVHSALNSLLIPVPNPTEVLVGKSSVRETSKLVAGMCSGGWCIDWQSGIATVLVNGQIERCLRQRASLRRRQAVDLGQYLESFLYWQLDDFTIDL